MSNGKLYRSLNECECFDVLYTSNLDRSERKKQVLKYYKQIASTCKLSQMCDIKISSALRIATQYGLVIEEIVQMCENHINKIPLDMFLAYDEAVNYISMDDFVEFFIEYNGRYEKTGVFLDEEKGHGQYFWEVIWEIVRKREFPKAISRLDSCFAFENQDDLSAFIGDFRGYDKSAEVCIVDAELQSYDMQWLTDVPVDSTMKEAVEYARKYWSGLKTDHPVMETLIYGSYIFSECQPIL